MEKIPKSQEHMKKKKCPVIEGSTVVLVTDQFRCERLIRGGRAIADLTDTELCVLNIQSTSVPTNPQAIQYLFDVSAQSKATMQLLYSDNALKAITQYIKENKVSCVITGMPGSADSVLYKLWNKFLRVHFFTVTEEGKLDEVIHRKTHGQDSGNKQVVHAN